MNSAKWGRSLILAGVMIVVTAAIIYWIWPEWMAHRASADRPGNFLIMGGGGALMSLLGVFVTTNHAQ